MENINFSYKDDILKIFGVFPGSEIPSSVVSVYKTWKEIDRDPMLWKTLDIDILKINLCSRIEREIVQVVQSAILLRTLYLSARDDVSIILTCVAQFCPRLETLRLQCLVEDPRSVQALVSGCTLIEDLEIDSASGAALNELAELKFLRSFAVSEADVWFDDTFLSRLSSNNIHLDYLALDESSYYNDQHLAPLFANLKEILKSVSMDGSFCSRGAYRQLFQCKQLEYLNIINAFNIKDKDVKELESLGNFTSLSISDVKKIHSSAIWSFIANFKSNRLSFIRLDGWPGVDHTLENVLMSHDNTFLYKVQYIDLSGCKNLTDRLVEMILKGNSVLESLTLSSIPSLLGTAFDTTDTTIAPRLKNLNVSECSQMVISYLYTFRMNRDHLTIVYPSG